MVPSFRVRCADWERDHERLRSIRETVFVREQKVPVELEWDSRDAVCLHVVAEDAEGVAIGTGRLLPDGHIGRMAVLASWRRFGVGTAILKELLRCAIEQGMSEVVANAQTHALGFYRRHGFASEGDVFLDAGIEHVRMRCVIGQTSLQSERPAASAASS